MDEINYKVKQICNTERKWWKWQIKRIVIKIAHKGGDESFKDKQLLAVTFKMAKYSLNT